MVLILIMSAIAAAEDEWTQVLITKEVDRVAFDARKS